MDDAAAAATELLARRSARATLDGFSRYVDDVELPARHHSLLNSKLEAVERGEIKRLIVMMPPGSAKSRYVSIRFPAWYLGRHPQRQILACSHTTDLAEKFGRRVRNLMGEPTYQRIFDTRLSEDSKAAGRWATAQGEGDTYYAAGVGQAIVGYRADLIVIDDPVKGREEADSENARQRVWDWYREEAWPRLKPGGAIVLVMQRWHEDDLAGRLLERAKNGDEQWHVLRLPMEAEEDDPLGRPVGEPLWPEWFTDEMRAGAKAEARTWLALYQQTPRAAAGGTFRREWMCWYDTHDGSGLNKYILVDAASGKRPTNDYTSMWVVGLGSDTNMIILDMIRDRLNLTQRCDALIRLHRKWHRASSPVTQVRYERYGMMADIEHIQFVQAQQNYRFAIEEVAGQAAKTDRIQRLVPWFEKRRVYFPRTHNYTGVDGITRDLVSEFIETEYLPFPVARHDDMMDALARIEEPTVPLVWPQVVEEPDRYRREKREVSTWI